MIYHRATMSLELDKIAPQISGMAASLKAGVAERQEHLRYALDVMQRITDPGSLQKKIDASQTTWLVAGLVEAPDRRHPTPTRPDEFNVIATDGSHIDVDRHQSARCCLLNIGSVRLSYGAHPTATLNSSPTLYFEEKDLYIYPPGATGRGQAIEGVLLGIKRGIEELRQLARLAQELPPASSNLALLDGSLILWGLAGQAYPEFVVTALLGDYLAGLEAIRKASNDKSIALASYISFPRSTDVVNTLRLAVCPHEVIDSDRQCRECQSRECEAVSGIQDREMFYSILEPGERSALFLSRSSVVEKYYGQHAVHFFYLRADDEIARIELPRWVALDESRLNLAHALALDQCQRGHGYPVALSEAHEKAVITGADRQLFWQMVEASLVGEHLPTPTSAKSFSKRARWI